MNCLRTEFIIFKNKLKVSIWLEMGAGEVFRF